MCNVKKQKSFLIPPSAMTSVDNLLYMPQDFFFLGNSYAFLKGIIPEKLFFT